MLRCTHGLSNGCAAVQLLCVSRMTQRAGRLDISACAKLTNTQWLTPGHVPPGQLSLCQQVNFAFQCACVYFSILHLLHLLVEWFVTS